MPVGIEGLAPGKTVSAFSKPRARLPSTKANRPSLVKAFRPSRSRLSPPSPILWSILESLGGCAFANTGKQIQTGADACSQPYTTTFLQSGIKVNPPDQGKCTQIIQFQSILLPPFFLYVLVPAGDFSDLWACSAGEQSRTHSFRRT